MHMPVITQLCSDSVGSAVLTAMPTKIGVFVTSSAEPRDIEGARGLRGRAEADGRGQQQRGTGGARRSCSSRRARSPWRYA